MPNNSDRVSAPTPYGGDENHFARLVAIIPGMLYDYVLNPDGSSKFLYVGPKCREILELTEHELLSDAGQFWALVLPEDLDRLKSADSSANQEGVDFTADVRIRTRSGCLKWIQLSSRPNPALPGEVVVWSGFMLDITRRKQTEAELMQAREEANLANQAKSQFLATMSHEIRTPMNGILGCAQLLLMSKLSESDRDKYARTVLNSGRTLLTLLNDILDLSKVEAGKMELSAAVFDPLQIVDETTTLFMQLADAKGLKIETSWKGTPGRHYRADSIRIRQMLSNLVGNAIKFTHEGVVQIHAFEVEESEAQVMLEFSVRDSGIGIPPDKQARLFQPVSQADSSTTREYGGTGLGLSIVRSLSKLMDGDVGLESELGKGSRFWFRVKVDFLQAGEESRSAERRAIGGQVPDLPPKVVGKILVADDNAINRMVIEGMLGQLGMVCTSVVNGQEAVDSIKQGFHPGMILMDMQMPVMDGVTATKHIRQWELEGQHPHLPIVALTADAFEEDRQNCVNAGMDDFLAKPLDIKDLATVLAKWVS